MPYEQLRRIKNRLVGGNPQAPVEYYVSPYGNNTDGLSLENAFTSITKGIDILNKLSENKKGAVLWVAPGTYIEKAGIELISDYNVIRCIENMTGRVYFIGSGENGSITTALNNLLKITGRYNIISGFTILCVSPDYAGIRFEDKSGGGGYGGQNLIEDCFFSPFTEDLTKYCVDIWGGARNTFRRCHFDGPSTAGMRINIGWGVPVNTKIEDCDFIGTNIGISIEGNSYNTIIRRCWFTSGSKTGENMDNAIVITSGMNTGKVSIIHNQFEQSAVNDILDNKTGGTLIEIGNENGA